MVTVSTCQSPEKNGKRCVCLKQRNICAQTAGFYLTLNMHDTPTHSPEGIIVIHSCPTFYEHKINSTIFLV